MASGVVCFDAVHAKLVDAAAAKSRELQERGRAQLAWLREAYSGARRTLGLAKLSPSEEVRWKGGGGWPSRARPRRNGRPRPRIRRRLTSIRVDGRAAAGARGTEAALPLSRARKHAFCLNSFVVLPPSTALPP